jgi:hypothetical protein
MTRQYRQSIELRLHALAPEHLLLLTIVGSGKTRRQVGAELDRRAAFRPKHRAVSPAQLQPAA